MNETKRAQNMNDSRMYIGELFFISTRRSQYFKKVYVNSDQSIIPYMSYVFIFYFYTARLLSWYILKRKKSKKKQYVLNGSVSQLRFVITVFLYFSFLILLSCLICFVFVFFFFFFSCCLLLLLLLFFKFYKTCSLLCGAFARSISFNGHTVFEMHTNCTYMFIFVLIWWLTNTWVNKLLEMNICVRQQQNTRNIVCI